MNEYINLLNFYLDGKLVYIKVVRLLSVVFTITISSYLYKYYIGSYTIFAIDDYKGILLFFLNGNFLIPLSFFSLVFLGTEIFGRLFFGIFTDFRVLRIQTAIKNYRVDGESFYDSLKFVQSAIKYLTNHNISPEIILKAYRENRHELKTEVTTEIQADMEENIDRLKEYFIFCIRALIAIFFIKWHLPLFHIWLFAVLLSIISFSLLGVFLSYHVASLIPSFLRKFCEAADKFAYFPNVMNADASQLNGSSIELNENFK